MPRPRSPLGQGRSALPARCQLCHHRASDVQDAITAQARAASKPNHVIVSPGRRPRRLPAWKPLADIIQRRLHPTTRQFLRSRVGFGSQHKHCTWKYPCSISNLRLDGSLIVGIRACSSAHHFRCRTEDLSRFTPCYLCCTFRGIKPYPLIPLAPCTSPNVARSSTTPGRTR